MTRDEAIAILQKPTDEAVDIILALAEKAENYEQICGQIRVLSTLLCKFFVSKSLVEGQILSHLSYGVCSPVQFHS
jgi:hypothetical protein